MDPSIRYDLTDAMMEIFLNSDTRSTEWLFLVLDHTGGCHYTHQCQGMFTQLKKTTGVGIPCGGDTESLRLQDFFTKTGLSFGVTGKQLTSSQISKLDELLRDVELGGFIDGDVIDESIRLRLDTERLDETVEAWIRVIYGEMRGVLLFPNSD